jgi:hypothetical protein
VPAISLLVESCLKGIGLPYEQVEAVAEVPFHDLDFALNALYDIAEGKQKNNIVFAAAISLRERAWASMPLKNIWHRGRNPTRC